MIRFFESASTRPALPAILSLTRDSKVHEPTPETALLITDKIVNPMNPLAQNGERAIRFLFAIREEVKRSEFGIPQYTGTDPINGLVDLGMKNGIPPDVTAIMLYSMAMLETDPARFQHLKGDSVWTQFVSHLDPLVTAGNKNQQIAALMDQLNEGQKRELDLIVGKVRINPDHTFPMGAVSAMVEGMGQGIHPLVVAYTLYHTMIGLQSSSLPQARARFENEKRVLKYLVEGRNKGKEPMFEFISAESLPPAPPYIPLKEAPWIDADFALRDGNSARIMRIIAAIMAGRTASGFSMREPSGALILQKTGMPNDFHPDERAARISRFKDVSGAFGNLLEVIVGYLTPSYFVRKAIDSNPGWRSLNAEKRAPVEAKLRKQVDAVLALYEPDIAAMQNALIEAIRQVKLQG